MSNVHAVAASGFASGTNEKYDRVRPSYPAGSLKQVYDLFPQDVHERGLKILEPGAGTGIFTRLMVAPPTDEYPTWNIDTLVAVEPSEGMREAWEKGLEKVAPGSKNAKIVDGTFDDFSKASEFGIKEGSVDLIIIAQAWHWCPDHEAAFTEAAKYLSPNGIFAFIWNLESGSVPWQMRIRELYQPYDRGTPQYYRGWWREGFKAAAFGKNFQDSEEKQVSWYRTVDDQSSIEKIMTKSYLTEAYLQGEERQKFIKDFQALLDEAEPEKEYVDKEKGTYKWKYDTDLVIMRKK